MEKGISIHIGLNRVDPNAYGGWDGALSGCINDAQDLKLIADGIGYQSHMLIDSEATAGRVIEEIARSAQGLTSGDILLLTYSGHGGQIEDVNGDEDDGRDETWVLYDRMLIDDELYSLWSQFESGVRIFVLSDSCHSGTVVRMRDYDNLYSLASKKRDMPDSNGGPPAFKAIPDHVQRSAYQANQSTYNMLQWAAGGGERSIINASILLISGCQDNQLSADGMGNGLFTGTLKQVWNNGNFSGDYAAFWKEIVLRMPFEQSPNFYKVGVLNSDFEKQKPFTIQSTAVVTPGEGKPSVRPPADRWSRDGEPPTFSISTGANRYYIFEITSDPVLFDITTQRSNRRPDNFYATWEDPNVPARLTATTFILPDYAWENLRDNQRLYCRIGTTSSLTGWDDYTVSTGDREGHLAPSMGIISGETPTGEMVVYPSGEEFEGIDPADVDDGIDYNDPTANGRVPLIDIAGRGEANLSPNFKVKEFIDDPRSHYARISPDLVRRLQSIRDRTGVIHIRSGYRHPAWNATVGGSSLSRHMSGEAVEIYSSTLSSLELVEIALQEMGCDIGVGLGPDYIGVDVRGSLATWVEPGAEMSGTDFRAWVDQICMRERGPATAERAYT